MSLKGVIAKIERRKAAEAERAASKPVPLVSLVQETLADRYPMGVVFNEYREKDCRHLRDGYRFVPEQRYYDYNSDSWMRVPLPPIPVSTRAPSRPSAIPQSAPGPMWEARIGGVHLWDFTQPDFFAARDEARALCQISGYDPRAVRVKKKVVE